MAKKEFNLDSYINSQQSSTPPIEYKEDSYVRLPEPVQEALTQPGFSLGHISMLYGLSDSGKTGILLNAIKCAQEQGILPVLIVTENKLSRSRIAKSGVDLKNLIMVEDLKFLESVYDYISGKVQEVLDGKLPVPIMIFWDSVAGCPSKDSFTINANGSIEKNYDNRKNANVIGFYNNIIAGRIAETRRKGVEGGVGVVMVTQAYLGEKPKYPPGAPAPLLPNGGEKIWFPLSLVIEVKEGQRLKATHKGRNIEYGVVSKLKVKKNHISELNSEGDVVLAGSQVLENTKEAIEDFKETRKEEWNQVIEAALAKEEN